MLRFWTYLCDDVARKWSRLEKPLLCIARVMTSFIVVHLHWWGVFSVVCPMNYFLIGSHSSGKSDEYYKKRYYFHDMVNCLKQHIAWLSLLVALHYYNVKKLTSPKIPQHARAAGIVVSLVTQTLPSARSAIDWLMDQDCSWLLIRIWWTKSVTD